MTASMYVEMVEKGDLDGLEMHCMEAIQKGGLNLAEMGPAFRKLERVKERERVSTLGRMLLDNEAAQADPAALLPVARATLIAAPDDATLRTRVVDLYRKVYGEVPGFDKLLEQSGLEEGKPPRTALRLVDVCLSLKKGDVLLSRSDDSVIEVIDLELESGLVTVRRDGRPRSISAADLSRDFEPIDADDFRVLRALRPQRLQELIQSDPVAVVIGLLRAHEGRLDQDQLKHELVPTHIADREWARWWTKAREALKRCPNVTVEGRSPVYLTFTAAPITFEDEIWTTFAAKREPAEWLSLIDTYLRDRKAAGETPDSGLIERFRTHLRAKVVQLAARRPTEALECALILERLAGAAPGDESHPALELITSAERPGELLRPIQLEAFWAMAIEALTTARPGDAAGVLVDLVPHAPAGVQDRIVKVVAGTPHVPRLQDHIDTAFADPVRFPEIVYWLWKGPAKGHGLNLPEDDALFERLIGTLVALDRTLHVAPSVAKEFRLRTRTALALRSAGRAEECLKRIGGHRAVTLRHQLERLEGLGDTLPAKMLNKLRELHPELWYVAVTRLEVWEDPGVVFSTKAGIHAKTEERDELVNVKMRDNARRIGEAAALGDLSENSEYKFALEERDLLRARLAQINHDLSIAQEIDPLGIPTDKVGIGSRLRIRLAGGGERTMTFLGPFDAHPEKGVFNYKAPVSLKLMGLHVGDKVVIGLDGNDVEVEVLEIGNGLKH